MDTISPVPTRPLYLSKPLSNPPPSSFRELFLGNIQEIGSSLSRLLDFHRRPQIPGIFWWLALGSSYEATRYSCARPRALCHFFSSAPVLLFFALSPSLIVSFSFSNCAVIVQQLEHSSVHEVPPARMGVCWMNWYMQCLRHQHTASMPTGEVVCWLWTVSLPCRTGVLLLVGCYGV